MSNFSTNNQFLINFCSVTLFIFAALCIVVLLNERMANWKNKLGAKLALLVAGLIPPTYLWLEFNFIWKSASPEQRPALSEFIHTQDVTRNLWLAFLGLIVTLYFSDR